MDKSMVKGGVFTLIACIVVLVISGIVIITSAKNMETANLWTQQLSEEQEITSGPIEVSGQFVNLKINTHIKPTIADKELSFSLPLAYTVKDSQGDVLASFDGVLDSNNLALLSEQNNKSKFSMDIMDMASQSYYQVLNDESAQVVKSESFPIEKPGALFITAKLGDDSITGTILDSSISLSSTTIARGIFAGCFVCCLVPVLGIVGIVLLIIGLLK